MQFDTEKLTANLSRTSGRLKLMLIAGIFIAPLFFAIYLYKHADTLAPAIKANRGHLVTPARPLENSGLLTLDGQPFDDKSYFRKWTMLYVGGPVCDELCQQQLYYTRQVRTATGREAHRVQRLYVIAGAVDRQELDKRLAEHPDLTVAVAGSDTQNLWSTLQITQEQSMPTQAQRIYLLDPHGNFFMYYESNEAAQSILKDLQRLLKFSQIG